MNITPTPNTLLNNDSSNTIAYTEQLRDDSISWFTALSPLKKEIPPDASPEEREKLEEYNQKIDTLIATLELLDVNKGGNSGASSTDKRAYQESVNQFVLYHYNEFQEFLTGKGVDDVIDTWKDVEDFLKGVSDDETMTLLNLIEQSKLVRGTLNIAMDDTIKGMMVATTNVLVPNIEDSHIDEETGIIRMVYKFE